MNCALNVITEYDWICELDVSASRQSLLHLSVEIYQLAGDCSRNIKQVNCDWRTSVVRRRGNALNELAVFYLSQAAAAVGDSGQHTFTLQIATPHCFTYLSWLLVTIG